MIGIYSIQSQSGKVYIGQSWEIKKRLAFHKCCIPGNAPYLHNSIKKYGFDSHEIKVLHELPIDVDQEVLDRYEQFYIDAYRNAGIELLNIKEGGSAGKQHPDSIEKGRLKRIGQKRTEETKIKQSESAKKVIHTIEQHKKIIESREKNGWQPPLKGKKFSPESIERSRQAQREWSKNNPDKAKAKVNQMTLANERPVMQLTKSGEFIKKWKSAREVERTLGIISTSIAASIRGVRCKHAGGFKWQYA